MGAFNGTTVSFNAGGLTPLVSASYTGSAAEVDVGGAGDASQLVEAGLPDESWTVELVGKAALAVGATGALVVTYTGEGALGFASAILTAVNDGGGYDGEITTSYTFRPYA